LAKTASIRFKAEMSVVGPPRVAPRVTTFPGLAIMISVMGINLLGDGLRDALDPRLRV
jgi:ABC-type dipeptide/oligopeptide/nickel transport system permease subunit